MGREAIFGGCLEALPLDGTHVAVAQSDPHKILMRGRCNFFIINGSIALVRAAMIQETAMLRQPSSGSEVLLQSLVQGIERHTAIRRLTLWQELTCILLLVMQAHQDLEIFPWM